MTGIGYYAATWSEPGPGRAASQDVALAQAHQYGAFAVLADGAGGTPQAGEAAALAAGTATYHLKAAGLRVEDLHDAIRAGEAAVRHAAAAGLLHQRAATTLLAVHITAGRVMGTVVGDSLVWLVTPGGGWRPLAEAVSTFISPDWICDPVRFVVATPTDEPWSVVLASDGVAPAFPEFGMSPSAWPVNPADLASAARAAGSTDDITVAVLGELTSATDHAVDDRA